jgi:formylmethanofuran dehydrogenase subunit D
MQTDSSTIALNNALNEVKNVCSGLSHTFIFREDNQILAKDQNTTTDEVNSTKQAFSAIEQKANTIGRVESISFSGSNGRVNVSCINDFYLTTVASNEADEKIVTHLTRILVPTMLKLVENSHPISQDVVETRASAFKPEMRIDPEPYIPDTPINELTVESLHGIGGLLGSPDIVRIDSIMIAQWNELFGLNKIQEITIENTITKKNMSCRFQSIKEEKFENKNVIQISEKILQVLKIKKGDKVIVKPITKSSQNSTITAQEKVKTFPAEPKLKFESNETYNSSILLPDAPFSQFLVENLTGIGGFMGGPEVVRVDSAIIGRWNEMFGDKKIEEVTIEDTVTGKQLRCKFKPFKESKFEGKGVIQMSEKVQQALHTKKGALVKVKPIVK